MDKTLLAYRLSKEGEWAAVPLGQEHVCPVCGFPGLDRPSHDRRGVGSLEICWCCGTQFGLHDWESGNRSATVLAVIHARLRDRWVKAGMPWHSLSTVAPPPGWDAKLQLDRLRRDH